MKAFAGLLALLLTGPALLAAPAYQFSLDGKPVHPKVYPVTSERMGAPQEGDLGQIAGLPFVLRGPGHYRFRLADGPPRKLFCTIDETPEQLAGLILPFGSQDVPEADWSTTALAIEDSGTKPGESRLPPLPVLPKDLRYLSIAVPENAALPPLQFNDLRALSKLRYFSLHAVGNSITLGALLASKDELRNLDIRADVHYSPELIPEFRELRFLKLRDSKIPLDASLFQSANLPHLRVLKLDGSNLTGIEHLKAEHIRLLSLNSTPVSQLPPLDSLPALRDLRLHSTPVSKNNQLIAPLRSRLNVLVKNWDPAIKGFEAHDAKNPPPEKPVLFLGSSSIRMWDLKKSFPDLPALNRGFGGSELSDALRYFDRIVLPYRPTAILLYAGDNDIASGETSDQVVADYKKFAARVRAQLPKTHFAFLPIKPSLKRWEMWPEMKKANHAIRKLTEADDHLHYLDTATPMLGEDGTPMKNLFLDDGLHMNEAGYAIWNAVVTPWLKKLQGTRSPLADPQL